MTFNRLNFNRFIHQLIFISLFTLISSTSIAAIYKWTDAEGNVHYGQQRPADTSSERMKVPQYAPVDSSTYKRPALKSTNSEDDAKTTPEEPDEEIKETKAEKKQRLKDCEQVRQNLATMESRGRVRSQDKDGNTRYLSQAEKEARMAKSRKTLSKHCK